MPNAADRAADKPRLIAGAMSGTSADGIDVAIVEITGTGLGMSAKLIRHHARPYDASLKQAIFALRGIGQVSLAELARLCREISLAYAACVNEALALANLKAEDLTAIAAHGQTLYHDPPNTIQWLDPALIAAETHCAVVSDFRRADCAAGGQGAPLVPFADYILFRHPTKNRVLINLGGIANLTFLPKSGDIGELIAFDTGPANCISDWLCRTHLPDGPGYDRGGELALKGEAHFPTAMLVPPRQYRDQAPPKSTDVPEMIKAFQHACNQPEAPTEIHDLLATACLATAHSIINGYSMHIRKPAEVFVSGGGTQNQRLMAELRHAMSFFASEGFHNVDDGGIPSEAKEAIAFALLAAATLDGFPSNVPSCTGAKRQVLLGSITPRPC